MASWVSSASWAAALGVLSAAMFSSLGRIEALGTSLRTETRDLRGELKADIAEVRTEVRELRTELHVDRRHPGRSRRRLASVGIG